MTRKLLFLTLISAVAAVFVFLLTAKHPAHAATEAVVHSSGDQVLAGTVRITLFAPLTNEQGEEQLVTVDGRQFRHLIADDGLGTLVRWDQELVIVTHDHWKLQTDNLERAEFYAIDGTLLHTINGEQFRRLIRYRDGGTQVLTAPAELTEMLTAVPSGDSTDVKAGDRLSVAYLLESGAITIVQMLVESDREFMERPAYRLISLNGEVVVGGNSGGAVLFEGRLVGNMWTTTFEKTVQVASGESSMQPTSKSLAAKLPVQLGS
jgi:hypothetical protein